MLIFNIWSFSTMTHRRFYFCVMMLLYISIDKLSFFHGRVRDDI
jgi:hypothetical protein